MFQVRVVTHRSTYSNAFRLDDLEMHANVAPLDATAQARFLNAVVLQDPHFVIRRIECGKFALSKDVTKFYFIFDFKF